jgi:HEAT repeat protein
LLLTSDENVNKCIELAMFSDNKRIRESMADILGEKALKESVPFLKSALNNENENFVIRSILHAISKIKPNDGILILTEWLSNNINKILDNKDYFMLLHIKVCIDRLDDTDDKKYLNDFLRKYGNYIEP